MLVMYLPEQFAVTADVEGVNVPPAWLGIVPVILLPFTHAVLPARICPAAESPGVWLARLFAVTFPEPL